MPKKLVVWDLDDTLWKGTLIEGVTPELTPEIKNVLNTLYSTGVIQSIASKNKIEDVNEVLNNLGITKYFLVPHANFEQTKSEMIKDILEDLGLTKLEDVIFIDDQEFNREEVLAATDNKVTVLDPNKFFYLNELLTLTKKENYTVEDRNRVEMYRQEHYRKLASEGHKGDHISFLKSCNMWAKVHPPAVEDMPRVVDLVARANKLSASYGVYDEARLNSIRNELLIIKSGDKYGDYGIVGVIHVTPRDTIELLVISCRMQGKGIGSVLLGKAINNNIGKKLTAKWIKTDYNTGMNALFEWYKFEPVNKENSEMVYELQIDTPVALPDWVYVSYMNTFDVRFMRKEEQEQVITLAGSHKLMKEFPNLWTRWSNWEKNPPIIVLDRDKVVGFHAATFNTRNPYVNSYYQMVSDDYKGMGLGGLMVDYLLFEANKRGNTRIKMLSGVGSEGEAFWKGFGLVPLFTIHEEVRFDADITGSPSCKTLIENGKLGNINDLNKIPKTQWKQYVKTYPQLEIT